MTKRAVDIVVAILALVIGGFIYVAMREDSYVATIFQNIYPVAYLQNSLSDFRLMWLSFYLPDYLWGLSFACSLISLFLPSGKAIGWSVGVMILCGSLWEMLQVWQVVNGTGDIWDVLMYFLAGATVILINFKETET